MSTYCKTYSTKNAFEKVDLRCCKCTCYDVNNANDKSFSEARKEEQRKTFQEKKEERDKKVEEQSSEEKKEENSTEIESNK